MTDFLFLLAKINLAMAAAILLIGLLRRPMRATFHAGIAYGLWLLVPVGILASLLPPRAMAIAAHPAGGAIPIPLHAVREQAAGMAQATTFDMSLMLFSIWLAGACVMALAMIRQQRRFHRAERLGTAGPAVTGFLRPRMVIPVNFAAQFNAGEQAAILAHETAHLARQDARINAVAALLRCVCWFNPLVHLGAVWLRKDQELACDARAVQQVERRDYANALLKSQIHAMSLPLGCNWPGAEHPLTERVALLKRTAPNTARRRTGMALIVTLALCSGAGAWAAQPARMSPVTGKSFTGYFIYSQRDGDSGPAFFMSLESDQEDKFNGGIGKNGPRDYVVMHFPYGLAQADSERLTS